MSLTARRRRPPVSGQREGWCRHGKQPSDLNLKPKPKQNLPLRRELTMIDHLQILLLRRTRLRVSPINIEPLSTVQIDQLLGKDLDHFRSFEREELLERQEVDVVRAVDSERNAKDLVCDCNWAGLAMLGVHARLDPRDNASPSLKTSCSPGIPRLSSELSSTSSINKLAVWSISTVSVITCKNSAVDNKVPGPRQWFFSRSSLNPRVWPKLTRNAKPRVEGRYQFRPYLFSRVFA